MLQDKRIATVLTLSFLCFLILSTLSATDAESQPPYSPPITMIDISGGTFQMGSETGIELRERPVHTVTVSSFQMSATEITQGQYLSIKGSNPSSHQGNDSLPVELVDWYDAVTFCNALSDTNGLEPCYDLSTWECDFTKNGFRLPTEAEWEYAARGDQQYEYGTDDGALSSTNANCNSNVGNSTNVGSYPPNPFGLYDMAGNVWEWCNDWYDSNYYSISPSENPTGPLTGTRRITRGGCFLSATACRSAFRDYNDLTYTRYLLGFRVVRGNTTIEQSDIYIPEIYPDPPQTWLKWLDFGEVEMGSTAIDTFTIINVGFADLIASYEIVNYIFENSDFTLNPINPPENPANIQPGDSLVVEVIFTPTHSGVPPDSIYVYSNDPDESEVKFNLHASVILPNQPPVAIALYPADTLIFLGEEVTFDGSDSYDPDGEIVDYCWDLYWKVDSNEDGDSLNDCDANSAIVKHTYSEPGYYWVILTVTDNQGASSKAYSFVHVKTPASILAEVIASISNIPTGNFDKSSHKDALLTQLQKLASNIEFLNSNAALARLDNIKKRMGKWITHPGWLNYVTGMMDILIEYYQGQDPPGKGKGKTLLSSADLPVDFQLQQNHPNPFNPSTTISYSVPEGTNSSVTLNIYDLRGRWVRALVDGYKSAGHYSTYWDGTDSQGRKVSSGVYMYRFTAGDFTQTRKMVILK